MSELVTSLLKGVPDAKRLADITDEHSPVSRLVRAYKARARNDHSLLLLEKNATGSDLKAALLRMDAIDQVALLYSYSALVHGKSSLVFGVDEDTPHTVLGDPDSEDAIEDRKLQRFAKKLLFCALAPIPCLIAGAAISQGVHSGVLSSGVVINSLLETSSEVLKIIFAE